MTNSLLISNSLTRVRELLEKYEFDVQGFVHDRLLSLYELPNEERPRVSHNYIIIYVPECRRVIIIIFDLYMSIS